MVIKIGCVLTTFFPRFTDNWGIVSFPSRLATKDHAKLRELVLLPFIHCIFVCCEGPLTMEKSFINGAKSTSGFLSALIASILNVNTSLNWILFELTVALTSCALTNDNKDKTIIRIDLRIPKITNPFQIFWKIVEPFLLFDEFALHFSKHLR